MYRKSVQSFICNKIGNKNRRNIFLTSEEAEEYYEKQDCELQVGSHPMNAALGQKSTSCMWRFLSLMIQTRWVFGTIEKAHIHRLYSFKKVLQQICTNFKVIWNDLLSVVYGCTQFWSWKKDESYSMWQNNSRITSVEIYIQWGKRRNRWTFWINLLLFYSAWFKKGSTIKSSA